MTLKQSIPLGFGIVLAVVAAGIIGAAMLMTDKGEELAHLYGDYKAGQRKNNNGRRRDGAMELQGRWRGLTLSAATSPTATALGVREPEDGVVVARVGNGVVARQGGLQRGDVITAVDNQKVRNLTDLYKVAKTTDSTLPTVVEVKRSGQTVAAVLPPSTVARGAPFGGPEGREGAANVWGAGIPAAAGARQNYYCPRDGTVLPRGSVGSPFCPRCKGPLHLYPPGLR